MNNEKNKKLVSHVLGELAVSLGVSVLSDTMDILKSTSSSVIIVYEWDETYNNINKLLYKLSPCQYKRHRAPTGGKDNYTLTTGVSYIIKLKGRNFALVSTTSEENSRRLFFEKSLHIRFFGKDKYKYRKAFMNAAAALTDKPCIPVKYLNEYGIQCDIIPRSFDSIVLEKSVKNNIILGLQNWKDSKSWYDEHHLVYKIGVFLYGEPGTGKSTVARAISNMFDKAPILVMDINNIMASIRSIIRMRGRYNGTMIVLIEDIDMYFPKTTERTESQANQQTNAVDPNAEAAERTNKLNQNAMFQLLDGIYSTNNTIYIATTNYKDSLDSALIRYGRFDIQEELKLLSKESALEQTQFLGYGSAVLSSLNVEYPVQPALLQSKIMEYRANNLKEKGR